MFVVLVEERWGINMRRRSLISSSVSSSRFAGRESALFFERCCRECKKKAEKKLEKNALLKYPAERGVGVPKKDERRIEVQVSETLRKESRKQERLQQQLSFPQPPLTKEASAGSSTSSISIPNSAPMGSNSSSPALKSLQVVAGTGAGFGFGFIFGPLGAIIGAVMGTGISAGAVSRGEPFFKPIRVRKKRRNKNRASSGTSTKFPQPTILTRAQIFAAFGKSAGQR